MDRCPVCNNLIRNSEMICSQCNFNVSSIYSEHEILSHRLDYWECLYEFSIRVCEKNILEKVDNIRNVEEIIVPYGIEMIGRYSFSTCYGVKKVIVPPTVKMIAAAAFHNSCIEEIVFESGSTLETIGDNAFENSKLKSIKIPKSVKKINDRAFQHCDDLVSFDCEKGIHITHWGEMIFYCSGIEDVTLPYGVTILDGKMFDQCNSLTYLYIPDSVVEVSEWYAECDSLKLLPDSLPDSVERINGWNDSYYNYFGHWDNDIEACSIFPVNLKTIGRYAFASCHYLNCLVFHRNLEYIDNFAFSECTNLKMIIIPDTAKMADSAFYKCSEELCIIKYSANQEIRYFRDWDKYNKNDSILF